MITVSQGHNSFYQVKSSIWFSQNCDEMLGYLDEGFLFCFTKETSVIRFQQRIKYKYYLDNVKSVH